MDGQPHSIFQPGALQGFPINNFRLHLNLSLPAPALVLLQAGRLQPGPDPLPSRRSVVPQGSARPLAAMAGFAAHLAEVGSAAELKFEH